MGTLAEYTKKTKGPFDGKPKLRVWVICPLAGPAITMALFTDEERAKVYAKRHHMRVTRWLADREEE